MTRFGLAIAMSGRFYLLMSSEFSIFVLQAVVKWGKNCGEAENHKRLRFSQGSGRDFALDSKRIANPVPDTVGNSGSKVQFQMRGCDGQV